MNKYILGIDGMGCGSCEARVQDKIRRSFKIYKVKASHINNEAIVISEEEISENRFHEVLDPTGYRITSYKKVEATKSIFGWR